MTNIRGVVGQDVYPIANEGAFINARMNPRGELVVANLFDQFALDGRVFNASNAVQETAEQIGETARGTDNVNPSLLLDAPTATTIIPLEISLEEIAGTSEDLSFTINTDDAARYSSGGVSITPINMRKDDPNTANGIFYSGSTQIVATANTDDDQIYTIRVEAEATPTTARATAPFFHWSAKSFIAPVLIGPASLLIFVTGATDDHTYFWSVKWMEVDTTFIT